jgi:3-hydroxybutyryl-CoA dehydratase
VSVKGDDAICRITCTLSPSGATVVEGTATLVPFLPRA